MAFWHLTSSFSVECDFSFVQGEFLSLCVKENAHAACNLRDAFLVSSRPQSPDVPINIGDQKNAILH